MDRLMAVLAAFSIALILQVLISVRREHIRVEYSVSWLGAAFFLLMLSLNHDLVASAANFLGAGSPAVAIVMIVLCVFLIVFYRFSIRISALKDANIALAQKVAILEYRIASAHEHQETANR